jgi:hypothetical protein
VKLSLRYCRKIIKSRIDYLVKGGKHGRGKKTLVPPPLPDAHRPYLVHRLAIYSRLCQSGLVADFAGYNSLAVLSGAGSGRLRERPLLSYSDSNSSYQEEKQWWQRLGLNQCLNCKWYNYMTHIILAGIRNAA